MKSAEFRVLLADSYGLVRAELKDHPQGVGYQRTQELRRFRPQGAGLVPSFLLTQHSALSTQH
ncbi:hypothetical protein [Nostoc sp.]|uniref:hypothetical protein n=1 Tax=Nostoc sp. TaxID=1180 RepID=UPI002FF895C9